MSCFLCGLLRWLARIYLRRCPAGVVIIWEQKMADVIEGSTVDVGTVKFINAAKRVLDTPVPTDAAATLDRPAGSVAVNLDGTGLKFTAGSSDGPVNIIATAGGFTSAPVGEVVVPDPTPAGVVVVPA